MWRVWRKLRFSMIFTVLVASVLPNLRCSYRKAISKQKTQPQRGGMFIEMLSGREDKPQRGDVYRNLIKHPSLVSPAGRNVYRNLIKHPSLVSPAGRHVYRNSIKHPSLVSPAGRNGERRCPVRGVLKICPLNPNYHTKILKIVQSLVFLK